jgi:hypothetical protein
MTLLRYLKWRFSEWPFFVLVMHFVERLTASDTPGETDLGLGVALAVLASPGAFASLALLDKYSTLLQYFRGNRHFDPLRQSFGDEYFFIVMSMTVTAMILVFRWNRLFPDRRDFANLAILPIPIYHVFLANLLALFAIVIVFAVVLNAVSSVLFPIFATMNEGTFAALFRFAIPHIVTLLLSSMFSFFAIFAAVGVLMLVLPGGWFRVVSVYVRIGLVIVTILSFFSNLFLQLAISRTPGAALSFLPSVWFLGLFETKLGRASPAMAALGERAVRSLAAVVVISLVCYTLSYRRHFLRLAEQADTLPASRVRLEIPGFGWVVIVARRICALTEEEWGVTAFAMKTLFRSERHLLFLGGYLGIGLVLTAEATIAPENYGKLTNDLLAMPLYAAFFFATALRFAADTPAVLEANWTFRVILPAEGPDPARSNEKNPAPQPAGILKSLILVPLLPVQLAFACYTGFHFGVKAGATQAVLTMALTGLFVESLVAGFQKLPFTCSRALETPRLVTRFLLCMLAVLGVIPALASIELWTLGDLRRLWFFAFLLGGAAIRLHLRAAERLPHERALTFEERPTQAFDRLELASFS